jgi:hypothetical protein
MTDPAEDARLGSDSPRMVVVRAGSVDLCRATTTVRRARTLT